MSKPYKWLTAIGVAFLVLGAAPPATAQVQGRYRVELMSGRYVEGDVKELPDGSYEVKTRHGVTVTVRRNEVRGLRAMEEPRPSATPTPATPASLLRREISEAEIKAIVGGIEAYPDEMVVGVARDDMMAPLPLDTESLLEMMRQAGIPRKPGVPFEGDRHDGVLVREHFVMVYTSSKDAARALGSRLQAVWRWNVRMLSMLQIPARRPEHKLEIYFFGNWDEFDRYARNTGRALPPGVLGYYAPDINRSHFFDLRSAPGLAQYLETLKRPDTPWRERQRVTNLINRYVEHQNIETIQHETGHHIHFNIGLFPRDSFEQGTAVPVWLVEGTTMLFEVPPSAAGASLGVLNHNRLFHLRRFFGSRPLDPQRWRTFLLDNSRWWGSEWQVFESYQLGWAMVYYLWREHRAGFGKYLQKVFGREEPLSMTEREAEFVECFGPLNEEWFNRFYAFLERLELRPSLVDPMLEDAARQQNAARRTQRTYGGDNGRSRGGGGRMR